MKLAIALIGPVCWALLFALATPAEAVLATMSYALGVLVCWMAYR